MARGCRALGAVGMGLEWCEVVGHGHDLTARWKGVFCFSHPGGEKAVISPSAVGGLQAGPELGCAECGRQQRAAAGAGLWGAFSVYFLAVINSLLAGPVLLSMDTAGDSLH